jgi:hypothetical protein
MKETQIDTEKLFMILKNPRSQIAERFCLKKCLYQRLNLITDDNQINYETINYLYESENLKLNEKLVNECKRYLKSFENDQCKFLMNMVHCLVTEPDIIIDIQTE